MTVARALAREAGAATPGRVWFTGERTTPELAAFANELMVRYLDFNDTYFALDGGHPSDHHRGDAYVVGCARAERAGCARCDGRGVRGVLRAGRGAEALDEVHRSLAARRHRVGGWSLEGAWAGRATHRPRHLDRAHVEPGVAHLPRWEAVDVEGGFGSQLRAGRRLRSEACSEGDDGTGRAVLTPTAGLPGCSARGRRCPRLAERRTGSTRA